MKFEINKKYRKKCKKSKTTSIPKRYATQVIILMVVEKLKGALYLIDSNVYLLKFYKALCLNKGECLN